MEITFWVRICFEFSFRSDVWPNDACFGSSTASAEEELMMLRDIFFTDLGVGEYQL